MLLLAILAGAATGFVLGLFGSGGSIIALPALMYLLGVEAKSAIAMSLGIVAVTATIGAWDHWRHRNVDVRVATVFGFFGVIGTFAGAKIGVVTPVVMQLLLFALVMYAAAWRMLKPPLASQLAMVGGLPPPERDVEVRVGRIAAHGIGVGVLTGLVGVGGGFLIVPALVLLSDLRMKLAIGTSLAIVAAKSYAGFFGYLNAVTIDWTTMAAFTSVTIAGSFVGTRVAHRFSPESLKRGFGGFLVVVATYILVKSGT